MVWEEPPDHAENTRCLVKTKILNLLGGFVDTKIGPVRQVRVTCCFDQYEIEIQVPSMSRKGSYSEAQNCYVDESSQDQKDPSKDVEMVRSRIVALSVQATGTIDPDEVSFFHPH